MLLGYAELWVFASFRPAPVRRHSIRHHGVVGSAQHAPAATRRRRSEVRRCAAPPAADPAGTAVACSSRSAAARAEHRRRSEVRRCAAASAAGPAVDHRPYPCLDRIPVAIAGIWSPSDRQCGPSVALRYSRPSSPTRHSPRQRTPIDALRTQQCRSDHQSSHCWHPRPTDGSGGAALGLHRFHPSHAGMPLMTRAELEAATAEVTKA